MCFYVLIFFINFAHVHTWRQVFSNSVVTFGLENSLLWGDVLSTPVYLAASCPLSARCQQPRLSPAPLWQPMMSPDMPNGPCGRSSKFSLGENHWLKESSNFTRSVKKKKWQSLDPHLFSPIFLVVSLLYFLGDFFDFISQCSSYILISRVHFISLNIPFLYSSVLVSWLKCLLLPLLRI